VTQAKAVLTVVGALMRRFYDRGVINEKRQPGPTELRAALSARELEVLAEASRGQTNAQVAARLGVTVHAVKFHLASIFRKLGVGNRTEAVVVYLGGGTDPE
jgi:DNA-binding CsgD family transcriptional regulator